MSNSLSVVVICRNEEAHIASCLQSVNAAADLVGGAEVIVVDSASTDHTVEIAVSYGARVFSLRSTWELSASAGRFVGFHKASGDLIMFVDGDTIIDAGWFRAVIPYFGQADVAGVMGYLKDFDAQMKELPYTGRRSPQVVTCPWLRGIGMYRRSSMEEAGTFNPYLLVEEEAELAFRLRGRGWKLLQVPHEMGSHMNGAQIGQALLSTTYRRRVAQIGSTWRYSLQSGGGMLFVFERYRPTVNFVIALAVLIGGIVLETIGYHLVAKVVLLMFVGVLVTIAIKKRSMMGPILYVGHHLLILGGFASGFFASKVKDPREYPLDAIEVETC